VLLGRTPLDEDPAGLRSIPDEAGLKRAVMQELVAAGARPAPAEVAAKVARVLSGREVRATLAALAQSGSEARYLPVDVQDAAALSAALEGVRREWGPIKAVVHAAGVLADKKIQEKTDEQFDRVFDTKVSGLRALLAATAADPLAALCLFSSVAARSGNPGQCDYAMANEVLNLVACAEQRRRGPGCAVRAIGWGPWAGGMVTPSLKAHFEQQGVPLIPLAEGARRFVEELGASADPAITIGGAGAGPLGAAAAPSVRAELLISARTHGYLADHRIAGAPVVPVALALEWMLRAARACRPDLVCAGLEGVKVLRGIRLDRFDAEGDRLELRCHQLSNGAGAHLAVELRGKGDALHYSATAVMTDRLADPPAPLPAPALERWTGGPTYDGHLLFHGPRFQVVRGVEGSSNAGLAGALVGTAEVGWPAEAWQSDPALIDGGLQLALLWARKALGGATLPMAVGDYRRHRAGLVAGPVRCLLHARQRLEARAVCDVSFVDAAGLLFAELRGVELVLRPAEIRTAGGAPALA
jgi:NAD(P)-dependent dehydrogenase (short-subunit alcohol dehydrogenase family)